MAYTTTNVIIGNQTQYVQVKGVEKIGKNLAIHRTVVRHEDGDYGPYFAADGETWVVTMTPVGFSLVEGLESREVARKVARDLEPAVKNFRAAVEYAREKANALTTI